MEKWTQPAIKLDPSSRIADGSHMVVSAADNFPLACYLIVSEPDQKGVSGRALARYQRLDRGLDVLAKIKPLQGQYPYLVLSQIAPLTTPNSDNHPQHKVAGEASLEVSDPGPSFFG